MVNISGEVVVQELAVSVLPPRCPDAMRLTSLVHQMSERLAGQGVVGFDYYLEHSKGGAVFVVREAGVIVAVGCYLIAKERGTGNPVRFQSVDVDVAFVHGMSTDAQYRGKGYGSAILQHIIQDAHAKGAACVQLTTRPVREDARRLYMRSGFTEVGLLSHTDPKTGIAQSKSLFEIDFSAQ